MTSIQLIEFFSIIFSIIGIIFEIFGVFIVMAPDLSDVGMLLDRYFNFTRINRLREMRESKNDSLTDIESGKLYFLDYEEWETKQHRFHKTILEKGEPGFKRILSTTISPLISPEDHGSLDIVFRAGHHHHDGQDRNPVEFTEIAILDNDGSFFFIDDFDRMIANAINRCYYILGGKILIFGFILLLISSLLRLWIFILN